MNEEVLEVLGLVNSIVNIMERDGHKEITESQIRYLREITKGKIENSDKTIDTLLDITKQLKLKSPYTLDHMKVILLLVYNAGNEIDD